MDLRKKPPFKPLSNSEVHREGKEAEAQEIMELSKRLRQEYRHVQWQHTHVFVFLCLKLHNCKVGDVEMLD